VDTEQWVKNHPYYRHIGLYGYRTSVLKEITQLPTSPLENIESLEQLRWLEAGYTITVGITEFESIGIDTPGDLNKIN
jgi:3-deoxy-manno-octulosonate cytidylyltransferase (CMP-KDO synthetase)